MQYKDKYNKMSLPAKATIWFIICNFILKGISFISGPLFTHMLSEDEYGSLSVFVSYEQLILILATWEIQLGAYQKGIFKYEGDVDFFTTSSQALINLLTIGCFAVIFIFNGIVTRVTGMPLSILVLLFIYLLVRPTYDEWLTRKRKSYDYKAGVTITLLYSIVNVLGPMIALMMISRTANIKFSFTLIGSSVICALFFFKHADYWKIYRNWDKAKEYWKFCLIFEGPLVLHSLSYLVLSQADRVMINEMVGSSQAAFYSVAYSIAGVVSIFQSSINSSLSPWRFQMLKDKNYKSIRKVTTKLLLAFGAVIILYILIVPEMMRLIFPADYFEAVWCIPPISTGIFFMFLYTIFVNIEEYYEQTKYVIYVSVSCGVINIILNYFFIQLFGYTACAYTTLFSYILFAFGHYYFMKKTLSKVGVNDTIIDGKAVLLISSFVTAASVLVTILYGHPLVRYGVLVIAIIISILNKDYLISTLTQIRRVK